MNLSIPLGIISYGVAIPSFRITVEQIANSWNKDASRLQKSLNVSEKSIANTDEDAATLAIDASLQALENQNVKKIGAIYVGSESHPYAVKPTATIVGNAIGAPNQYFAADLEFACKAGTAAMQIVSNFVASGAIESGLAIGADTAQGAPGDILEYTAAAGAASFCIGRESSKIIATIDAIHSYNTDTHDFWRPQKSDYPEHSGRFTGTPAYFHHVENATKKFLKKIGAKIADFDHVIFHMPNGTFPKRIAKDLSVTPEQLECGFIVPHIGNTYSASSLLGLASVLDHAQPNERILLTSYGSGAGADSVAFTVTENIMKYKRSHTVQDLINKKEYVTYQEYVRMRGKMNS